MAKSDDKKRPDPGDRFVWKKGDIKIIKKGKKKPQQ